MQRDETDANADDGWSSLPKDPGASTADRVTRFWEKYWKEACQHDEDFLEKNGDNIEGVMLFAGLFSAVAASFLVSMQADLKPDPTNTTNTLLMMLVHSNNNTAFANQDLGIPVWNGPSSAVVYSQALGYAALSASLLAALGAVLGKQWLSDFIRLRSGPLQERSLRRQQKLDGLKTWRFEFFMGALPALIQLALLLFSIALAIKLWELNHGVGSVVIAATSIGVFFYLFITVASLLFPTCPFRTPVSSTIHGAMGVTMKSVEEVAEYWAWRTDKHHQRRPTGTVSRGKRMLAYITTLLLSPLLAITSTILMTIFATFGPLVAFIAWVQGRGILPGPGMNPHRSTFRFKVPGFHAFICCVRDIARRAQDFMRRVYLDSERDLLDLYPRSITWLLERSTDPDNVMAAAEVVTGVEWPKDLDVSLTIEHLYVSLIRSIPERGSTNNRALQLGKAFVFMLCQMPKEVSTRVWKSALDHVTKKSRNLDCNAHSELLFILTIVTKLLAYKLGSADRGVELPKYCEVTQPLLAWLLQPLEILLRLEHPRQSRFLPEAYQVFLMLKWPEESKLEGVQEVQYCRTFEIYFNSVVGANDEDIDEVDNQRPQKLNELQTDRLKRILEKLKQVNLSRLPDVHQHLIVPLTVLSRLASVSYLQQTFKDAVINRWMLAAFKEAVGKADESGLGGSIWPFASCIMKLATVVDAFSPIPAEVEHPPRDGDSRGQTPMPSLRMDSKSLLLYLLNKETPAAAASEQTVYALKIMHTNVDELPELVANPDFVNYILYATGPGQVYSVRDTGLKVLIAACQYLLHAYNTQSLEALAADCDLVRFLRRAILNEDTPTILIKLLHNNDEDFNANLLKMLATSLGDPFNALLTKLREEPNKIPERDLRDLEIALVLSKNEGRKKLLYDHLDSCIALMPLRDYKHTMALPLAVIVGWLLRRDGPLSASEDVWKALLRPNFEELLYPAWRDPDMLEDNPQMLRLLLDCTTRWLSMCVNAETGSSGSPSSLALTQLDNALDQLRSGSRALSLDIKRALVKLSREIKRLVQE